MDGNFGENLQNLALTLETEVCIDFLSEEDPIEFDNFTGTGMFFSNSFFKNLSVGLKFFSSVCEKVTENNSK